VTTAPVAGAVDGGAPLAGPDVAGRRTVAGRSAAGGSCVKIVVEWTPDVRGPAPAEASSVSAADSSTLCGANATAAVAWNGTRVGGVGRPGAMGRARASCRSPRNRASRRACSTYRVGARRRAADGSTRVRLVSKRCRDAILAISEATVGIPLIVGCAAGADPVTPPLSSNHRPRIEPVSAGRSGSFAWS
jgi:hypothetical protein